VALEEDQSAALAELLAQVRRRLALLQGAVGVGLVAADPALPDRGLIELAQELLSTAVASVEAGCLGYELFIARKGR
jgi:hypothetical protein